MDEKLNLYLLRGVSETARIKNRIVLTSMG